MSFGDTKPSVPSIMVSMMGDVNIVYINIDFLNETFFMKFTLSRILSGLANFCVTHNMGQ